jgi:CubicO group peptidase (beta-lactamase class C family)
MARLIGSAVAMLAPLVLAASSAACGDDDSPARAETKDGSVDAPIAADAAPPPVATQDVATILAPIREGYGGVPGLGAVVMHGADVAALGVVGARRAGGPTEITASDRFHLGGDVQTMTATLAAMLVDEGKLTWSSRLGDVLPDVAMHPAFAAATLEALLAQRAGAPALLPTEIVVASRVPGDPAARRGGAVASLVSSSPTAPAGTFQESDASFLLAAAMVERAASQPWETLVAARLFAPLGMTTCGAVPDDPGATPSVPWGHVVDVAGTVTPVAPGGVDEPPVALAPAQGMRCSLVDWARFAAFHLAGARGEAAPLLTLPSFAKLQTPVDFSHALGWYAVSRPWAGSPLALNFISRDRSSYALAWVLPGKNAVVLVAVNQGGAAAIKVADDAVAHLVGSVVSTFGP